MPTQDETPVTVAETEWTIRTAAGGLFAKSWTPESADGDSAPPILLFHDSLGSVDLWRSFPQRLAAGTHRRVIAYDRFGFGRSDPHPGRIGLDFVAAEARDTIAALCEQAGVTDFVACGHSVGGGMAVEVAARFPERCKALVTIAAQAFVEEKTLAGIRAAKQDFQDPANAARLARYHGAKAQWVLDAWTETWLSPGFADWTLDHALAAVRCPVLALHGDRDEYGSNGHPERIAAGRGSARILPDTGHVPHREKETLVVDAIRDFLAEG
ncbi:alpha/beta fold hydrolase [Azospirillum isscasi]|uniref:Alpha/beta hydrolase n=1 Tax=Azospirillum isscasi TaxID=3053926 RepID=A0ABU0WE29_9PROT|nr:alpha/beta hydrolase [Azospirillum isscasi]MDQ2102453.1 alpha/beta hydrolase [Azospirillum isscasi]